MTRDARIARLYREAAEARIAGRPVEPILARIGILERGEVARVHRRTR